MNKLHSNINALENDDIRKLLWRYFLPAFAGVIINNVCFNGVQALSWNGESGAVYDVEMATDLISTNWVLKDSVPVGVDGTFGWTNPVVEPGPLYFYRVIRK